MKALQYYFTNTDFLDVVSFFRQKKIIQLRDQEYSRLEIIIKTNTSQLTQREIGAPSKNDHSFNALFIKNPIIKSSDPINVIFLKNNMMGYENNNPYFVLELFLKFKKHGISVTNLVSLDALEFIKNNLTLNITRSSIDKLLEFYLIDQTHTDKLIKIYLGSLKLLDYHHNIQKNELFIYTHAIKGLNEIKQLARALKVAYHDDTLFALKRTIDFINYKFEMLYKHTNKISDLFDASNLQKKGILEFLSTESSLSEAEVIYVPKIIEHTMVYMVNAKISATNKPIEADMSMPRTHL